MTSTRRITEMVMAPRTAWWSTMRATRWILVLTVFAATLTVRANDTPLLIELEPRTRLFPAGVSAAGAVLVGALDGGGGFYWMPTTGVIANGGVSSADVSRDGRTMIVTAHGEDGGSRVVGGNQNDNSAAEAGAAFVFGT